MQATEFGDLSIELDESSHGVVRLEWKGKSNSRDPGAVLLPYLKGVADRTSSATVEMHFELLDFFNSSTITALIQFVQEMRQRERRLLIVFNAQQKWQKLSFEALRIFEKADGLLELRAAG